MEYILKFQFHKGTIRTGVQSSYSVFLILHFNSIKVRLEHFSYGQLLPGITFQFHKGTIRT